MNSIDVWPKEKLNIPSINPVNQIVFFIKFVLQMELRPDYNVMVKNHFVKGMLKEG